VRSIFVGGAFALVAAAVSASAAPPQILPLEIYGKLPAIQEASLSPDGTKLAVVITDGEARKIIVKDIATGQVIGTLKAGEHKIRSIQWAGSNHLIITSSVTSQMIGVDFKRPEREELSTATDYNVTKNSQRGFGANASEKVQALNVIYGQPTIRTIDGRPFAFTRGVVFVSDKGQLGLFKVDLDRGDFTTVVDSRSARTTDYLVDAAGKPLAETEYDGAKKQWTLSVWKDGWREVRRESAAIDQPELSGLGKDGAGIVISFPTAEGDMTRELSIDHETWTDPTPSPDALIRDPTTHRQIGTMVLDGDEARYTFFNPVDQNDWQSLVAAYKGDRIGLVSMSDNHRRYILRVDSAAEGPAYAYVDLDTHKGDWIGDEYEGLTPEGVAPVRPLAFKARDGLALTGYLTLPRNRPPTKLPLVVLPHGGPAARDEPGFDWWSQALAARGYAVLRVNYRGSAGFGWAFQSAGFGQWGRKMQTDLSDGVRYLAAEGTIDPARVCIVGASYGGYAALAGATLDPGVYRCAASLAGPSDLRKIIDDERSEGGLESGARERYRLRYMGPREDLSAISPADHADKVTIPILLMHGKDDTVVPYSQSEVMADALRRAGKTVEFVTLSREDHWLSQGATRLEMLQAVVAFLEKNNPSN
jgi:dipeptidyl aminopeptidase/acylaminoacyl peptidase